MSARKAGKRVPVVRKAKTPMEMSPDERAAYVASVGGEIDRLLSRRGCVLDVQPTFSPNPQGAWSVGVVARVLVKDTSKAI